MPYIFAFIFGLLASFGALLVELFYTSFTVSTPSLALGATPFAPGIFDLLVLALIEETSKIIFFFRSAYFNRSPYNTLLFALIFGTGFASLEYFAVSFLSLPISGPMIGILIIHIITSILLIFALKESFDKKRILFVLAIITLIHFGYNLFLY